MANTKTTIQLPHSNKPQKPITAEGVNVSGFYTLATTKLIRNTIQSRQNGMGIKLLASC